MKVKELLTRHMCIFSHSHLYYHTTSSQISGYFITEMLKWKRSSAEHVASPAASEQGLKRHNVAKVLSSLDCVHAVCGIHISHISKL